MQFDPVGLLPRQAQPLKLQFISHRASPHCPIAQPRQLVMQALANVIPAATGPDHNPIAGQLPEARGRKTQEG